MPSNNRNGRSGSTNKYIAGNWNFICRKCKIEKPSTEYYLHSHGKPRKQCKVCVDNNNKKNRYKYKHLHALWQQKNKDICLQRTREWRAKNLEYDAYRAATRRATKKNQTPKWANLDKIKQIYLNCPKGLHVDHIIPLKGLKASGLHVEQNLQYLTPTENFSKRNRFGW